MKASHNLCAALKTQKPICPAFYFEHHGKELHSKHTYEIQAQPVDPLL